MKLVAESLEQILYDRRTPISSYHYELLAEGIQFKNPKDAIQQATKVLPNLTKNKRLNLLALLFLLNTAGAVNFSKEEVQDDPIIVNLASDDNPTYGEIVNAFDLMEPPRAPESKILQITPEVIADVDSVRFSDNKIDRYNQYDEDILKAVEDLKAKGENADPNLIKTLMMIETGMNPVKNKWGFEGFPQTKEHIINGWTDDDGQFHPGINQKYGTNFTIKDMYNAYSSAQFMHYYLKALQKSKWVKDTTDMAIAYNWGIGNLGKYKRGEQELRSQSKKYVDLLQSFEKHFPSS